MEIYEVIWLSRYVKKLAAKHQVTTYEVEAVIFGRPLIRFWEKGAVKDENLRKSQNRALPISARDMTDSERRYYNGQKS